MEYQVLFSLKIENNNNNNNSECLLLYDRHFEIYILYFLANRLWHLMQNASILRFVFLIFFPDKMFSYFMKNVSIVYFLEKRKKNTVLCWAQIMVKVKIVYYMINWQYTVPHLNNWFLNYILSIGDLNLTHKRDIGKQYRPRSDAIETASD